MHPHLISSDPNTAIIKPELRRLLRTAQLAASIISSIDIGTAFAHAALTPPMVPHRRRVQNIATSDAQRGTAWVEEGACSTD